MEFLPPEIDDYAGSHTAAHSKTLAALERETWQEVLMPRMLSGHQQGRFLSLISHLMQPQRVLEIGTYTGYSALCMAEGLSSAGVIHTIDINAELRPRIERFMEKAGYSNQIQLHIGNALEIIPSLQGPWDLVFIDADKENYTAYFDLVVDHVRPGGLIIADNVLWSGKVADLTHQDHETVGLRAYNEKIATDPRVVHQLLPFRDGLMVARKLKS